MMFRLGLLMLGTLLGLFVVLQVYGGDDLRAARRPAPAAPQGAAADAGTPALADRAAPAGSLPAQAPAEIIPAASQTPEQVERFPGPPLQPSPEYAGRPAETEALPPAAGDEGPVLYVTGSRVNMRTGPGTSNPVVTSLSSGTTVTAIGPVGGDWVQIRTGGGQTGFIAGQFLSPEAP
ncbi:MAG: hypothetical protein FJX25_03060 [Alphaproteobacteria bacterium]|nr:hypothetical protein [Alphaproteobacteria bacterium]